MARTSPQLKDTVLNLRIDPDLKTQFASAARAENKPIAEAVRDLMRAYVESARHREFVAEARRQSQLVAGSADEAEVMRWIENVSGEGPSV
jgi:hypothetical protein